MVYKGTMYLMRLINNLPMQRAKIFKDTKASDAASTPPDSKPLSKKEEKKRAKEDKERTDKMKSRMEERAKIPFKDSTKGGEEEG